MNQNSVCLDTDKSLETEGTKNAMIQLGDTSIPVVQSMQTQTILLSQPKNEIQASLICFQTFNIIKSTPLHHKFRIFYNHLWSCFRSIPNYTYRFFCSPISSLLQSLLNSNLIDHWNFNIKNMDMNSMISCQTITWLTQLFHYNNTAWNLINLIYPESLKGAWQKTSITYTVHIAASNVTSEPWPR